MQVHGLRGGKPGIGVEGGNQNQMGERVSRASLVMSGVWQRKNSCTMTLRWKVWVYGSNGKKTSGAGSRARSRATDSKAQRGEVTSLKLHSQ